MDSQNEQTTFPDVAERPVAWVGYSLNQAHEFKAIVDLRTNSVFSVVSKNYKLIKHEEALARVEEALKSFPDLGEYSTKTEFHGDGARMLKTYRLLEIQYEIQQGDFINPELRCYNSYDVTWPFIVLLGAYRFVCSNGLVVGKSFLNLRKRHVFHFDSFDLKKQISDALTQVKKQCLLWQKWSDQKTTAGIFNSVLQDMSFGKKGLEQVYERLDQEAEGFYDNGVPIMSLWIFYNVLTWYITHKSVSLNHRIEMERRLRSAIHHFN